MGQAYYQVPAFVLPSSYDLVDVWVPHSLALVRICTNIHEAQQSTIIAVVQGLISLKALELLSQLCSAIGIQLQTHVNLFTLNFCGAGVVSH